MSDLGDYWENGCPVRGFYLMLGAGDAGSAAATGFHVLLFVGLLARCLARSLPGGTQPPWGLWLAVLAVTFVVVVIGKIWRRKQRG